MLRHIVMWNFKDGFTDVENINNAKQVKKELEALAGIIPGVILLKVIINPLASSNSEIAMTSLFESEEALVQYQVHPEHIRVSRYVGTVTKNRSCLDYFE